MMRPVHTAANWAPASAGATTSFDERHWIPAFAGMTTKASPAPRRFGPTLVDLGLLRRGGFHIERAHLRSHRQLVRHAVGQLHARHRGPHEALRENALSHIGHDEVEPELAGVGI